MILCFLRTIYSRFKDSGIIEQLVAAGVGTEGTSHLLFEEEMLNKALVITKFYMKPL